MELQRHELHDLKMKQEEEITAIKREQMHQSANVVARQNQLESMMKFMLCQYNSNEPMPQPMLETMSQPMSQPMLQPMSQPWLCSSSWNLGFLIMVSVEGRVLIMVFIAGTVFSHLDDHYLWYNYVMHVCLSVNESYIGLIFIIYSILKLYYTIQCRDNYRTVTKSATSHVSCHVSTAWARL